MIDQAYELGARRFYFTGGEPFVRDDICELIRHVTEGKMSELIIMTNATLFQGGRLDGLKNLDRERLKFQVSLDGTRPEVNDPIRGRGVFERASQGLKTLNDLGFATSLTAAVTKANLQDLEHLPALAQRLGAKSVHLMWLHKRGRILETSGGKSFPTTAELLALSRKVKESSDRLGVLFDNFASILQRVNGRPGIKYDLGNLCWEAYAYLWTDRSIRRPHWPASTAEPWTGPKRPCVACGWRAPSPRPSERPAWLRKLPSRRIPSAI